MSNPRTVTDPRKLRLALIGCGAFPYNTLYPMLRNLPIELAGICDLNPAMTERFSNFYRAPRAYGDFKEMIDQEKPEAVLCVTNLDTHYEAAKYCLERGINILTEKAPCQNADQAEELSALQKKSGKFHGVLFNRRWGTAYTLAKEVAARGDLGKLTMIYSKFNTKAYKDIDFFVYNHIIHMIDLTVFIAGELSSPALQALVLGERSGALEIHCRALESGALCTIQSATEQDEAYPMERLDLAGTRGNLTADNWRDFHWDRTGPGRDMDYSLPLDRQGDSLSWHPAGGYGIGRGIFSYMGFEAALDEFVKAALGEGTFSCTIEDCIPTMRFTDQVRSLVKNLAKER
ncbi:MAG: Gfo/Idh/MocA family oxidoreductase [Treponema sp.]|nr:Gfo/Idh/MocA family oxidoreductase [Treponema sp.]